MHGRLRGAAAAYEAGRDRDEQTKPNLPARAWVDVEHDAREQELPDEIRRLKPPALVDEGIDEQKDLSPPARARLAARCVSVAHGENERAERKADGVDQQTGDGERGPAPPLGGVAREARVGGKVGHLYHTHVYSV